MDTKSSFYTTQRHVNPAKIQPIQDKTLFILMSGMTCLRNPIGYYPATSLLRWVILCTIISLLGRITPVCWATPAQNIVTVQQISFLLTIFINTHLETLSYSITVTGVTINVQLQRMFWLLTIPALPPGNAGLCHSTIEFTARQCCWVLTHQLRNLTDSPLSHCLYHLLSL